MAGIHGVDGDRVAEEEVAPDPMPQPPVAVLMALAKPRK
jgi:hypothetical protein